MKQADRSGGFTCRRVRALLQARADSRGGPSAPEDPARLPERAAEGLAAHLAGCPRCRRFQAILDGYPQRLAAALEAEVRDLPAPDCAAALREGRRQRPQPQAWTAVRGRLRWALPAAAAALLLLGFGVTRLAQEVRIRRGVRAGLAAVVDSVYARTLAEGVESAADLLEELDPESGLQEMGSGLYFE